jgi:hypothetical protein
MQSRSSEPAGHFHVGGRAHPSRLKTRIKELRKWKKLTKEKEADRGNKPWRA